MKLHFKVEKQELKRIDSNKPVDFSSEYLQCRFDFLSDDWNDFGKFAIFRVKDKNYRVAIAENICTVPFDALKGNRFILTVYGVKDDVRITTNFLRIYLEDSAFVDEYDESSYFNPDMTEELLDLVETKTDKSVFNDAVSNINDDISDLNNSIESINTDIGNLNASKTDINLFNETVSNLEDSIDTKTDISVFNETISNLENDIDTKTDKTVFNETVSDLEDSISNLDSVKVDTSVFSETVDDINDSIGELDINKTINITKQEMADTGYFSTYVISQGGTALYPKINIPKDYLLKSASLKQCTVKDEPIEGLNVGDWYFDWVLNTADETEESHLYLNANVFTDVYEGDNETIIIVDNVISVKPNVFAFKVHTHSKAEITDFAHTHTESDITDLRDYALESEVYSKSEVDDLIHNIENKFFVTSDTPVIQTDDNLELYAKMKSEGFPVTNKTVHFYQYMIGVIYYHSYRKPREENVDIGISEYTIKMKYITGEDHPSIVIGNPEHDWIRWSMQIGIIEINSEHPFEDSFDGNEITIKNNALYYRENTVDLSNMDIDLNILDRVEGEVIIKEIK